MRSVRSTPIVLSLALLVALLAGCMPIRYVTQAAAGQEQLNRRGIAIRELVEGGHLDARTRGLLSHVAPIKAFGERHGLARTDSYERYVWLDRPAVVWVVSACSPLAFRPRAWKFPIVGSITYTGWFDRAEAEAYAGDLAREGWDVDLRPSQAYSTLGWFDDPILSTMISSGDAALGDLADVVLHETLHATFYVAGQSTLNESVASFFGNALAAKYLDEVVGPDAPEKASFLEARARAEERGRVMKRGYEQLAALYADPARSREAKLADKRRITDALRAELGLRRPVTNATLIQYKTYGSGKAELAALFARCGDDHARMLRRLEDVRPIAAAARPHADPAQLVRPLLAGECR